MEEKSRITVSIDPPEAAPNKVDTDGESKFSRQQIKRIFSQVFCLFWINQ